MPTLSHTYCIWKIVACIFQGKIWVGKCREKKEKIAMSTFLTGFLVWRGCVFTNTKRRPHQTTVLRELKPLFCRTIPTIYDWGYTTTASFFTITDNHILAVNFDTHSFIKRVPSNKFSNRYGLSTSTWQAMTEYRPYKNTF